MAPPLLASPLITLVLATFLRPCLTKFRHWSEMALKKRHRVAKWRQTTQRWVETATATEKSAIVNGYFFWHYKMSACFIKWAARDKRSPTSLNCGQIVEDKTTENKKVIPLRSCELSKPFQIMAIKRSYLSLTFSFNQCFYDHLPWQVLPSPVKPSLQEQR